MNNVEERIEMLFKGSASESVVARVNDDEEHKYVKSNYEVVDEGFDSEGRYIIIKNRLNM